MLKKTAPAEVLLCEPIPVKFVVKNNNVYLNTQLFSGTMTCKKVIFLDSDMVWTVDQFKKLMITDKDVLTGVYVMSNDTRVSVASSDAFMDIDEYQKQPDVFEVKWAGLGFVSCSFEALQKMQFPWFEFSLLSNGVISGEDVYFFKKLTSLGYHAYCDKDLEVGHEKPVIRVIPNV
jgi:hypothetical protein